MLCFSNLKPGRVYSYPGGPSWALLWGPWDAMLSQGLKDLTKYYKIAISAKICDNETYDNWHIIFCVYFEHSYPLSSLWSPSSFINFFTFPILKSIARIHNTTTYWPNMFQETKQRSAYIIDFFFNLIFENIILFT